MWDFLKAQFAPPIMLGNLMWGLILAFLGWVWGKFGGWTPQRWKLVFYLVLVPITFTVLHWAFDFAYLGKARPAFRCGIEALAVGVSRQEGGVGVGIAMWIVNTGSPSIVRNWSGYVLTAQSDRLDCTMVPPSETQVAHGESGTNSYTFGPERSIVLKCLETPIPTGGEATGMIWFHLPTNVSRKVFEMQSKKVVVVFHDAYGTRYEVSYPTTGPFEQKLP